MILDVFYRDSVLVGQLADQPGTGKIFFRYSQEWLDQGIELSPLRLPLAAGRELIGHHQPYLFEGLCGVFADSLPGGWGRKLLDRRLAERGIHPQLAGSLVRLSFLGDRAMGALSFRPDADPEFAKLLEPISIAQADRDAQRFIEGSVEGLQALIAAGTSPGGARPKVLALVRGEAVRLDAGVEAGWDPWIIKLSEGGQEEVGKIEFAYAQMARAAGLVFPDTRLFDGQFFGAKRFDRSGVDKFHVHSLGGLLHAADGSYEDLANAVLQLSGDHRDLEAVFRRAAFNVAAMIRDDHMQNVALLMDPSGHWSLSPCYDLTPNIGVRIPNGHSMTINGTVQPQGSDLLAFADQFGVEGASAVLEQVREIASAWPKYAELAEVRRKDVEAVGDILRIGQHALRPSQHGFGRV